MDWSATMQNIVYAVLAVVIPLLAAAAKKYLDTLRGQAVTSDLEKQAADLLLQGTQKAQDLIVRPAKESNLTGKLMPDQIAQAREMAISTAKQIAEGPVKDLLQTWGTQKLESLVSQLVQKMKKGA